MEILKIKQNIIDQNIIPDLTLNNGEICGIFINNEIDYSLIDYLTEKKTKKEIVISKPFYEVKDLYLKESSSDKPIENFFVRKFIKKKLNCNDSKVKEILKNSDIGYDWDMNLYGNARRILSTLIALENHKNIIYNTFAIDNEGAIQLNKLVREKISQLNGCAIELNYNTNADSTDSMVPLENYDTVIEIKSV